MELRKCKKCQQEKELTTEFFTTYYRRRVDGSKSSFLSRKCNDCLKIERNEKLSKNSKYKEHTKKYKQRKIKENKDWLRNIKSTTPCMDCKVSYPYYVMEYDHVKGTKIYDIARLIGTHTSMCRLSHELKKCELVCSNCHKIRSFKRKSIPLVLLPDPVFEHVPHCRCHDFIGTKRSNIKPTRLPSSVKKDHYVHNKILHKELTEKMIKTPITGLKLEDNVQ